MKKTFLALCTGIMIGLFAGSISGAFAAVGDKVEAVFTEYKFIVDGEHAELDVLPVAINDSAYLPLRAFANLLGYNVTWHDDSWTIELTTPKESTPITNETERNELNQMRIRVFESPTTPNSYYYDECAPAGVPQPSIEEQIKKIESDIAHQERIIESYTRLLAGAENDAQREGPQLAIHEAKAKKADLEAQKAELEAKLKELEEEQVE